MSEKISEQSKFESNESLTVGVAHPEDARSVAAIQKDGWLTTYVNEEHGITEEDILAKNFDSEEKINRWKESLGNKDNLIFVAKEAGEVVDQKSGILPSGARIPEIEMFLYPEQETD